MFWCAPYGGTSSDRLDGTVLVQAYQCVGCFVFGMLRWLLLCVLIDFGLLYVYSITECSLGRKMPHVQQASTVASALALYVQQPVTSPRTTSWLDALCI